MTESPAPIDRDAEGHTRSTTRNGTNVETPPKGKQSDSARLRCAELVATFVLFAAVMHFLYAGQADLPYADRGAPGHDSFYHVKMAVLMTEIGLPDQFPWLRTTVFNENFVNHHYGFQWLMSFAVRFSNWLTGDYVAGGRWFITACFGLAFALFNLLLMAHHIKHRWLWVALCLLLPSQFYGRHLFIRAICPSLVCMLLLCWCMFTRRWISAGIVICLSIHVYLGAVVYAPLLVICVVAAACIIVLGETWSNPSAWQDADMKRIRSDAIRLAAATFIGWLVGLWTHPYGGTNAIEFLRLQVFGSGLTPDIEVGQEWQSYTPAWFFAQMSGLTLTVMITAIAIRLRFGARVGVNELALFLMQVAFLTLTLKARRFIEYWPVFATLSAAYLAGPLIDEQRVPRATRKTRLSRTINLSLAVVGILGCAWFGRRLAIHIPMEFVREWQWWAILAALAVIIPQLKLAPESNRVRSGIQVLVGCGIAATVSGLVIRVCAGHRSLEPAILEIPWWFLGLCVLSVFAVGWFHASPTRNNASAGNVSSDRRPWLSTVSSAALLVAVICVPAGALFGQLQQQTRCQYDLPAIREVMDVLNSVSEPGDVVFTDDWDIFPVYFYLNHRNHYVVGLDPKFSHQKDPVLWERYVRISRGETPVSRRVTVVEKGKPIAKRIHVRLSDIRDHFHAKYVITDSDHMTFANKLADVPNFARRIHPATVTDDQRPSYQLFEILPAKK